MRSPTIPRVPFACWIGALALTAADAGAQVRVVDMIPAAMSDETRINSEPYLTVNPANPLLIAATAFMATPAGSPNGPLLVSTDGGVTWVARNIIPSAPGSFYNTGDVTIRFNTAGTALYGGILRAGTGNLEIIRTTDMTLTTAMTTLNTPRATDQPYIYARTVTGAVDAGKDRLWVGNNEGAASPASATIDQSLDANIAAPTFTQVRIDADAPVGRDNYQVRTVSHADGHVYGAFYRRKGSISGGYNADVVVVRDDDWGKTVPPFVALVDAVTTISGENVVASTPVTDTFGSSPTLGNEWWGGDLYLTVDPADGAKVYISYSDSPTGAPRTLHLRRSSDHGQTWDPDILTTASAKNAAIAINSEGRIGYLYQQLAGTSPNRRWQTHLRRSLDGVTWDDVILADFPAEGAGSPGGSRIVGDYLNMVAVGQDFYGVFSSYNDLGNASFPAGVTWLRNKTPAGAATPRFLGVDGVTTVAPSIDPFFFRTMAPPPGGPRFHNALSLHAGAALPLGTLNTAYDPGPTGNIDLIFALAPRLALDFRGGLARFSASVGGGHLNVWDISANLKFMTVVATPWVFVNGGVGAYKVGSTNWAGGANVGIGVGWHLLPPTLDGEATINYHRAFTPGPDVPYLKVQLGLIARF